MAFFFCRLNPPRPSFVLDMTPAEGAAMSAHADFWRAEAARGSAVVFGPVVDPGGPWGLGVVEVADEAAARALLDKDPAILAGVGLRYDLFPMMGAIVRPAVGGGKVAP
jgi:uncharacterized protein YciI